jgi:hypothetical protein
MNRGALVGKSFWTSFVAAVLFFDCMLLPLSLLFLESIPHGFIGAWVAASGFLSLLVGVIVILKNTEGTDEEILAAIEDARQNILFSNLGGILYVLIASFIQEWSNLFPKEDTES